MGVCKLTDRQHKRMIEMYADCGNYSLVAREFGVSISTVRRHCNGDPRTTEMVNRKKAENSEAILSHMDGQKARVCGILDRLLDALDDTGKMNASTLTQLATAFGILVDKFSANEAPPPAAADNNLLERIRQSTSEEIRTNAIPEAQPPAEPCHDVVEPPGVPGA